MEKTRRTSGLTPMDLVEWTGFGFMFVLDYVVRGGGPEAFPWTIAEEDLSVSDFFRAEHFAAAPGLPADYIRAESRRYPRSLDVHPLSRSRARKGLPFGVDRLKGRGDAHALATSGKILSDV